MDEEKNRTHTCTYALDRKQTHTLNDKRSKGQRKMINTPQLKNDSPHSPSGGLTIIVHFSLFWSEFPRGCSNLIQQC